MAADIHIIACSVFKDAIAFLEEQLRDRGPSGIGLTFEFLPSNLHLYPVELRKRLLSAVRRAQAAGRQVGCLYGTCFPGIEGCLKRRGVWRSPRDHCYEVFLGRRRYRRLIDECPGSFFVEKELLLDFDDLCRTPLELDDPEIRRLFFTHYSQVVYIRQPNDPDLMKEARFVADLINLNLCVIDVDYEELKGLMGDIC